MILIVFGVSGTGKSTIGYQLAQQLHLPFYDGDDFHPQSNIQKMKNGNPLNDQDRQPWLASLAQHISDWENEKGAVLACSALKEGYRQTLASLCKTNIQWVLLNGSRELLLERLNSRNDHFFDPQLLDSQLDTLELPDYGWTIDIQKSPSEIINKLLKLLSKD
ncbi:gluconokinase [Paraglaciecola sp. 2405UD69-4]|uniref:gluconokinase n=1 Tax=Paraglaciecola sp. 2405UD69-4 TaxID=3391836 RepID=UPI0039C9AA1E